MLISGKRSGLGAILGVAGLLLTSGAADASTIQGVVVHHNKRGHSFVVADARGRLTAVHAKRSPAVGRRVAVRARRLRNGTYLAQHIRAGKRARRTRIRGRVTHVDRRSRAFVVSARGTSMLVRLGAHKRGRAAASAADSLPAPGSSISVDATLSSNGTLSATRAQSSAAATGAVTLEGVVISVDASARTVTISADDNEQTAATITVALPTGFDPSAYTIGNEVELAANLNSDGSYTAVGSSDDDNADEADGANGDQGDISAGDQGDDGSDQQSDVSGGDQGGSDNRGSQPAGGARPSPESRSAHGGQPSADSVSGHGGHPASAG